MLSAYRSKILRTANLYLLFFGVGLVIAVPGPTLLELEKNINMDTYYTTFIYTARSSGYLFGSILGGFLLETFGKETIILLCIFFSAVTNLLIPMFNNIYPLIATMACSGLAVGFMDTGSNVWLLELWTEQSGPFMQALHFLFGLGAFVAPILANPFLPSDHIPLIDPTNSSLSNFTRDEVELEMDNYRVLQDLNLPKVTGCYVIISLYMILVGFSFLTVACTGDKLSLEKKDDGKFVTNQPKFYYMLLPMCLLCLYTGTELAYGQFLTAFCARSSLNISPKTGSLLTSLFWVSFTFFRCFGIALAAKFTASTIIIGDLILMNIAAVVLAVFGDTNIIFLGVGTSLLGIAMSSVFPAMYSWVERYTEVTSKVASCLVISAALGEMMVPLFVGYFVDLKPMYLMYIILACSIGCLGIYFGIVKVFSKLTNDDDNVEIKGWNNKFCSTSTEILAKSF